MDKQSSNILPNEIKHLSQDDISTSNTIKWKSKGNSFYNIYSETKQLSGYNDLIDGHPENILQFILKLYYDGKTLDPVTKSMYECICKLVKTIEMSTERVDNQEYIAKLDAVIDFIKEHESK
jgi:hypothetical protein